jgi:hypothetical protein
MFPYLANDRQPRAVPAYGTVGFLPFHLLQNPWNCCCFVDGFMPLSSHGAIRAAPGETKMNAHEQIEMPIARRLIRNALAKGYSVSVYDGEEWALKRSTDRAAIIEALASTDCDTLRFRDNAGNVIGSMLLIWGNDDDLISDYSDNDAMNTLFHETV